MAIEAPAGLKQAMRKLSQSFRQRKESPSMHDRSSRGDQPTTSGRSEDFFLNCQTGQATPSYGCCHLRYTQASYQARDPVRDDTILLVEANYVVAAVVTALEDGTIARDYVKKNIARELQRLLEKYPSDHAMAVSELRSVLVQKFREQHPFAPSGGPLDRIQVVFTCLDLTTGKLYLAGTGGARAVAASSQQEAGAFDALADVHAVDVRPTGRPGAVPVRGVTVTQLGNGICRVILGSAGFWRDVPAEKAFLRLGYFAQAASHANGGNAAAHLLVYALHNITERTVRTNDPRMKSLKSVAHLKSLQKGDISNYKWGGRQPVRRLAGDVHGDLTCIVLEFSNAGNGAPLANAPRADVSMAHSGLKQHAAPSRAAQRWGLVRMHFLQFSQASRCLTERRWQDLIQRVLAQHRVQQRQLPHN